ncbi:MAG: LacI family DNA-binding transcriptional regulator [Chloroflexi bacterium]|nr:LacI family DNA-binding transcriptional regulator [Chloroflexota bacterium]
MQAKSTQEDVAKKAGVSVATVSYVMSGRKNGRSRISEATKKVVLAAAKELNYLPNAAARDLRRGKSDRICLVLPVAGAPINNLLYNSVDKVFEAHGYFLISCFAGTAEREYRIYQQLLRGFADGVIFFSNFYLDESHFNELSALGIAVVAGSMLTSRIITSHGFDVIRSDASKSQEAAVRHLRSQGHSRIAIIWDETNLNHVDRVDTYTRIMRQYNLAIDPALQRNRVPDGRSAYEAMASLLTRDDPPTAVLATSDRTAEGALNAAKDRNLQVPGQLAIIGFGNTSETAITTPQLTTIGPESWSLPVAAQLMLTRLEQDAPMAGRTLDIPAKLLLRETA